MIKQSNNPSRIFYAVLLLCDTLLVSGIILSVEIPSDLQLELQLAEKVDKIPVFGTSNAKKMQLNMGMKGPRCEAQVHVNS